MFNSQNFGVTLNYVNQLWAKQIILIKSPSLKYNKHYLVLNFCWFLHVMHLLANNNCWAAQHMKKGDFKDTNIIYKFFFDLHLNLVEVKTWFCDFSSFLLCLQEKNELYYHPLNKYSVVRENTLVHCNLQKENGKAKPTFQNIG